MPFINEKGDKEYYVFAKKKIIITVININFTGNLRKEKILFIVIHCSYFICQQTKGVSNSEFQRENLYGQI